MLAAAGALPVALLKIDPIWKLSAGFLVYGAIYVIGNIRTNSITTSHIETVRSWVSLSFRSATG
jgi:hypothetical protein